MRHASVLAVLLVATWISGPAHADNSSTQQCKDDGKQEFQACRAACQEAYQVSKDMCRNVSHDCAEGCRASRDSCVAGPLAALDACKQGCATQFEADKEPCTQLEKRSAERDACVDAAQVKAFQCRDTCRENVDHTALQQCYKQFRSCIKACPPPPQ
ncbi:MAG TPA: hypothetical protein VMW56_03500 [Candidatus Margulisiibacteriota bacterium]|nr:hypothetical protein [Candidatus Margulisiibacteriota bacterium]